MKKPQLATGSRLALCGAGITLILAVGCSAGWQERLLSPDTYRLQLAWVADQLAAPVPEMPKILISRAALYEHTNTQMIHASLDRRSTIQAAYVPGLIILDQAGFDEGSSWDMGFLIHELVHHVQHMSGRIYPCPAAREREAYQLQNEWLVMMGHAPAFSDGFISQNSRCRNIREAAASGH
ncbi:DUF6647 family protein [Indioceanicola profundi]|uniref:DUF6647 family protein n=1 Tax=Indioceanicola profundi TaxID=2220096 RepID=UPI0013C52D00|nr:DUF6647 family protein [Indioceanicola profundi]